MYKLSHSSVQGMKAVRNTPQLGQGVLALQHLVRVTERLPSGAMIHDFEKIDPDKLQFIVPSGNFPVLGYPCHGGLVRVLKCSMNFYGRLADPNLPTINIRTLRRETVMLRWLSHTRVVSSFGFMCQAFTTDPKGVSMLVLPLIPNGNLREFLIKNPNSPRIPFVCTLYRSPLNEFAHTMQLRDVASAIQYLYGVGILHCDLKSVSRIRLFGIRA
jgi:serine/threonine protein kinase